MFNICDDNVKNTVVEVRVRWERPGTSLRTGSFILNDVMMWLLQESLMVQDFPAATHVSTVNSIMALREGVNRL